MAQAKGQVVKLVGRTTDFKGKTLWEIVGNLKGFGVGRIVIRNMFQRYPEPSYIKILKVEARPNEVRVDLFYFVVVQFSNFNSLRELIT